MGGVFTYQAQKNTTSFATKLFVLQLKYSHLFSYGFLVFFHNFQITGIFAQIKFNQTWAICSSDENVWELENKENTHACTTNFLRVLLYSTCSLWHSLWIPPVTLTNLSWDLGFLNSNNYFLVKFNQESNSQKIFKGRL